MNIQNDKKKPSIFRRVVTIVCCLSVMLMLALPSLAVGVHDTYPETLPPVPYEGKWMIYSANQTSTFLIDVADVAYIKEFRPSSGTKYYPYFYGYDDQQVDTPVYTVNTAGTQWVLSNTKYLNINFSGYDVIEPNFILYANCFVTYSDGSTDTDDRYYILDGSQYPVPNESMTNGQQWILSVYNGNYLIYRFANPASVVADLVDGKTIITFDGECNHNVIYPEIDNSIQTDISPLTWGSTKIVASSFNIPSSDGGQFFPPVPDPTESVTAGLGYVLNWVGQTVSQLFDGTLSGLLPLVAVPVAVTLLIVAIFFIKRTIWGG